MRALLVALAVVLALAAPALAADPKASLPDIEDEVMCAECGTALSLSNSAVANDEREFIREQIALGKSKEEIKAALVDRYGPAILALPEDKGFNLAAYLVPAILVLGGLAAIAVVAARWRRPAPADAPAAAAPLPEGDQRRLDEELAAFDR